MLLFLVMITWSDDVRCVHEIVDRQTYNSWARAGAFALFCLGLPWGLYKIIRGYNQGYNHHKLGYNPATMSE